MAHSQQQQFMESVRDRFPHKFSGVRVLDVGSLDINGNNRFIFTDYQYIGLDIGEGKNVDVVCRGHEYKSEEPFDVTISSECFEHDEYWVLTFTNMVRLTKEDGMVVFSCASEHGTRRTSPNDSPFTSQIENDYYKNLNKEDFEHFPLSEWFSEWEFIENRNPDDLYFWGIRNNNKID
jgi:SAM-dependent methyltransferase